MNSPPKSPRICVTATSGPPDCGLGFCPMASARNPRRSRAVGADCTPVLRRCRRCQTNQSLILRRASRGGPILFVLNPHRVRVPNSACGLFGFNCGFLHMKEAHRSPCSKGQRFDHPQPGASPMSASGQNQISKLATAMSALTQFSFTSLCSNAAFRRPTVNVTWRRSLTVTMN